MVAARKRRRIMVLPKSHDNGEAHAAMIHAATEENDTPAST